jgi:hypothetical protein
VPCQVLSVAAEQVPALPAALSGLTVAVRTGVGGGDTAAAALTVLRARGARTAVHLLDVPGETDPLLAADADLVIFEPSPGAADELAFALKRTITFVRGRHPATRLLVAAGPATQASLKALGVAPYADGFIASSEPLEAAADLLAPRRDEGTVVRRLPADAPSASAIARAAVSLAPWFPPGLVAVRDRALRCGEDRRLATFLNPQTLDLVGSSRGCPAPASVTSDEGAVAERRDADGVSAFRVAGGSGDRFAEGVTVGAARALSADEIVARHQAAAARQAAGIETDLATGTLTLTIELPGFVAPVSITAKTTIFRDAAHVDLQQADIRVNGVPFSPKDGVPRLPIVEPERVAVVPLTITLTNVYRYTLDGRDVIDGRPCYVIGFTPLRDDASLFSGRTWIDERTFGMVRVSASQTGLKGPIVASEQIDTFVPDAAGRWLLARSDIRQSYEGAAVRTPIHRLLVIDAHEINAGNFAERRRAAYASPDVILRDTPDGFRYLKQEAGGRQPEAGSREPDADAARTVAPPVTYLRTLAAGVIVDPDISTPLPFAGLSYVDFDVLHTGTQFSGFFGGSYAQAAWSVPSIAGTRWQIAGRAFAIAASYNDRAFVEGKEIYARDIRQRPAQASVWLLRPIATRALVRIEYDWDYNHFSRGDQTDAAFVIPRSQNAQTLRAGLDLQHRGWQASFWGSQTVRIGWERWGVPGSAEDAPPQTSFQRAGASVLRTTAISPRVTARIEGSIVAGRGLDRFSRMSFGAFDNRLHGYPSALIRYDRGAVLRTAISWAAANAIRLDGFADTAAVHDPSFGSGLRNYTGFGAAVECPAPFGTLLSVEWGYGVQGVNTDGRPGTQVLRITGYKVF